MPQKSTTLKEGDIAKAAYWRAARPDLSLEKLAKEMGVNHLTLKKRLKAAIERDWLAYDWVYKGSLGRLGELLPQTKNKSLQQKIIHSYGEQNMPKLTVVPAWPPDRNYENLPEQEIDEINMRLVAHAAAKVFIDRLPKMKIIGLSYGRTLKRWIDSLEHFSTDVQDKLKESKDVQAKLKKSKSDVKRIIVTISGSLSFSFDDKRHSEWLECSASYLTNRLARILGTDMCERRFLETPVYVPHAFLEQFSNKNTTESKLDEKIRNLGEGKALQIARAFVEAIPIYNDIFVKEKGRGIEKLDTLITSAGDLGTGFGVPLGDTPWRQVENEALRKEAAGDIAGLYMTKFGETAKPNSTIAKVNDRIFGVTMKDLEGITKRAAEKDKPGVIVIASSRRKAPVISAILNHHKVTKIITELIISGDLAEEIVKIGKSQEKKHK